MKQTIKVEITVYVGSEKYLLNTYHTWDSEEDELSADDCAKMLLEHMYNKMCASLDPCFFHHEALQNG